MLLICISLRLKVSSPAYFWAQRGRCSAPGTTALLSLVVGLCSWGHESWTVPLTSNALPSSPWNPSSGRSPPQGHFLPHSVCPVARPARIGRAPCLLRRLSASLAVRPSLRAALVPPAGYARQEPGRGRSLWERRDAAFTCPARDARS